MASFLPTSQPEGRAKDKAKLKYHDQGQNPSDVRKAKPQGPLEEQGTSQRNKLPDLRFLNHNKPRLTASSILDPGSVNSNNISQLQALKEAEAWYGRTLTMLQERLELCEKMKTGLYQINTLLAGIHAIKASHAECESQNQDSQQGAQAPGELDEVAEDAESDLKAMEEAFEAWVQDVRVSRAKWIAGGTDMERRMGLK